jgi:hypothetical protein
MSRPEPTVVAGPAASARESLARQIAGSEAAPVAPSSIHPTGVTGSNVPSPCKVPTQEKSVPGAGRQIGVLARARQWPGSVRAMRGYRNSDIGLTATPTRTDMHSERSLTATRFCNGSNVPSP